MAINRNLPEIGVLLRQIEDKIGFRPVVHDHFDTLRCLVFNEIKEHMSETTLERVWGYSTRGYKNVSLRTLNVLSVFAGYDCWENFCTALRERGGIESDMFDTECVSTADLAEGESLIIGWQPNRLCRITYLGNNRFVADETLNSKLRAGDTFSCLQLQRGTPLFMENVISADGQPYAPRLGVGLRNGLSLIQRLSREDLIPQ